MTRKQRSPGGPTAAVNLLKTIHSSNAAASADERTHMIADIDHLLDICSELLSNIAGNTGSILNNPEFKAALNKEEANHLVSLASSLIRDTQTYSDSLAGMRAQADQFRLIEDWPNMLTVGLSLSQQLADWQNSYATVVLPIKDQIDKAIQAVIDRSNKG